MGRYVKCACIVGIVAAVLVMAAGEPAWGGERNRFFGIGAHASYYGTGDADSNDLIGGVQVRLKLFGHLSLEAAADYRKEEFDDGRIEVKGYPFQLAGLWYLFGRDGMVGALGPHLIFGGSWYSTDITVRPMDGDGITRSYSSSDFGYFGGFGVDIPTGDRLSFHGDVRYQFLDVNEEELSLDHDGYIVQAGLTFYF